MKRTIILLFALLSLGTARAQRTTTYVNSGTNPPFQLSFIYPVTTSGWDAINTDHHVSIHVLAGATKTTNGVEVAGFGNFNREGLQGVQAAGFANYVGGNSQGVQAAGFANVTTGNFKGVQAAGFVSASIGHLQGVQANGFASVASGIKGTQASGFTNLNLKKTEGLQASGFLNTSLGGFTGAQVAGFTNVSLQESEGIQISGFINVAQKHEGVQLSFFNYADSLDGIAIGFISYSRNGYHKFEISGNETFQTNFAFRTGTKMFYNIFSTGIHWDKDDPRWTAGYGIGTTLLDRNNWNLQLDLLSQAIFPENFEDENWAALNSFKISLSRELKMFEVFAGASINAFVHDRDEYDTSFIPWTGFSGVEQGTNYIVYPGFQAGIRL